MRYLEYEDYNRTNADVLFILKDDIILSDEKIWTDLGLKYQFRSYNRDTGKWERDYTKTTYELHDYDYGLDFTVPEFVKISDCYERLKYAYANMFEDTFVDNVVMDRIPDIEKICKPPKRSVGKYYLQHWMKKYNFTLEDFIFNDKYIVLHDNPWTYNTIDKMFDYGLIDWDNVAICSEENNDEDVNEVREDEQ